MRHVSQHGPYLDKITMVPITAPRIKGALINRCVKLIHADAIHFEQTAQSYSLENRKSHKIAEVFRARTISQPRLAEIAKDIFWLSSPRL